MINVCYVDGKCPDNDVLSLLSEGDAGAAVAYDLQHKRQRLALPMAATDRWGSTTLRKQVAEGNSLCGREEKFPKGRNSSRTH